MNNGFQYFAEKLYGKSPVRIVPQQVGGNKSGYYMSKPIREIYKSTKDGGWNDLTTWETVSGRPATRVPTVTDDVYIKTWVWIDGIGGNYECQNLFITGYGILSGGIDGSVKNLTIYGNIQCDGTLDQSNGYLRQVYLKGDRNFINAERYIPGTQGILHYARDGNQDILNLPYRHLSVSGFGGTKYLTSNLVLLGNFAMPSAAGTTNFEMGSFDAYFGGTTTIESVSSVFSKNGAGNLIFVGHWSWPSNLGWLSFTGNPTVELRGGFGFYSNIITTTGTGLWRFTATQSVIMGYNIQYFDCPMLIDGAYTVTILSPPGGGAIALNNYLDSNNAGATLDLRGRLYMNTATYPLPMFTLGTFIYNVTSTAYIGWIFNGAYTIPYTTMMGFALGGTGTKTLSGNTTVTSLHYVLGSSTPGILECSTYDFSNTGTTQFNSSGGTLSKNGAGNILLVGLIQMSSFPIFNFTGNPNVEMRTGISSGGYNFTTFNTGTGTWTFSTNNCVMYIYYGQYTFNCNIVISGAIYVQFDGAGTSAFIFNGTVDGNNASSKLDNRNIGATNGMQYKNAAEPMATGLLETNAAPNVFKYNKAGNQDVKGGTYRTLEMGTSGVKRLMGNVTVPAATYSVTGTATVDLNGFTLTLT